MIASNHLLARMNQRSIRKCELDIVMAYGEAIGDKVVLDKKTAEQLLNEFRFLLRLKKEHSK